MKRTKRIFAIFMTMALAMSMLIVSSAVSFAADPQTYSLTITHDDNITDAVDHVYKAYQIITGDISGTAPNYTLSNMKWGTNAPSGKIAGNALTSAELAETKTWTADSVKTLVPTGDPVATATKGTDGNYVISGLAPGYYVVQDETNLGEKNDANSSVIVQVVGNTSVQTKRAIPSVDKQVYDDEEAAWSDAADHDLYESFQFKLIATIPADPDYAAYPTYKVVFHDTMSVGVAYENIASVKVGTTTLEASDYAVSATPEANNGDAESTWTLTINDIKPYVSDLTAGTTVEVIYNAHLTNKVETYYKVSDASATPTNNKVYLEYSNKPGATGTGKTAEDTVWVFTYEVDNTKVDGTNNNAPLPDAGFRLYKGATEVSLIYDETISAYRPIKDGENGVEMKSASDGKFNIKGLDPGTYTIKETTTPPGYNTMPDKTIEIAATTVENANGNSANLTMTKHDTENTIVNEKGSQLPSTGGIGTVIFYVLGSLLIVGCGIILISKRRMENR